MADLLFYFVFYIFYLKVFIPLEEFLVILYNVYITMQNTYLY